MRAKLVLKIRSRIMYSFPQMIFRYVDKAGWNWGHRLKINQIGHLVRLKRTTLCKLINSRTNAGWKFHYYKYKCCSVHQYFFECRFILFSVNCQLVLDLLLKTCVPETSITLTFSSWNKSFFSSYSFFFPPYFFSLS